MRLHLALRNPVDENASPGASAFIVDWLSNREHILDSLLSNLDGMAYCCLLDEYWTMLFVSDGCQKLTGYQPDDLLNNGRISYEEITLPEDRAHVREAIQQALHERRRFDIEYRIRDIDGNIHWVSERGTGVLNQQGEVEALEGFIQDITARRDGERALQEAEQRYRSIFENTVEGIFQTSLDGHYLNANPALAKIYGFDSAHELIANFNDISQQLYVDPHKREEFSALMQHRERVTNFESQVYRRDGSIIWISENARAVRDESGELLYYEGTVEDITERKSYSELIEYQATHDDLTGLPNRTLLKDRLQQAINQADRTRSQLAVVFVDLDQFKDVNDSMGHHTGDLLLIAMAKRLQSCVRDSDTVARPGGDEFVLILSNLSSAEALNHTLQRILSYAAEPCYIEQREFIVTCSLGISMYPDDGRDSETLLKNADTAMYKAKQAGKNNFQFFTKELNATLLERLELEYRLRQAVLREEFVLHYQPKRSFADGRLTGMEALIRWQTQDGLISPDRFIAVAEESSLIDQIGEWVMYMACQQCVTLAADSGMMLPVSINLSPRQFYDKQLIAKIESVLARTGLPAGFLELEITEGTLVVDPLHFTDILKELKKLGIKLAIDDFGTGYSSMGYLKHFPIDNLKIDQSFVRGLEEDPANQAILKAVVILGHNLGLNVIAEGVETELQRDFLVSIGCDEMQGYLFSRPLPMEELSALIRNTR